MRGGLARQDRTRHKSDMQSPFDSATTEVRTAATVLGTRYNLATVSGHPAQILAHPLPNGKIRVHCMGQSVDLFPSDRVVVTK